MLGPLFLNTFVKDLFFLREAGNFANECSPDLSKITTWIEDDTTDAVQRSNFTFIKGIEQGKPQKLYIHDSIISGPKHLRTGNLILVKYSYSLQKVLDYLV